MLLNSHDTSSHPNRAMNHALIGPVRIVIAVCACAASHPSSQTINAAGIAAGMARTARRMPSSEGPYDHIALAPLTVKPAIASATSASSADAANVHTVDSGVIR